MIGIDIVSLKRFDRFLKKFPDKALQRFLNSDEISLVKTTQNAAGFFAAKEAVSKALGVGISKECSFFDIIIHKDEKNAPYFTLSQDIVDRYSITQTALSITHDGDFAIAVAQIESDKENKYQICH
jgi:holo-[acyl-carrier protein] synthase